MIKTLAVAAALTTTLALAGCSDDDSDKKDDSSETSSSATPSEDVSESPTDDASETPTEPESAPTPSETPDSPGSTITGTGYTFDMPEGWGEQEYPEGVAAQKPDVYAVNGSDSDGFADNVNVLLSPASSVTKEQIEQEFAAQKAKVAFKDSVTVAGSDSLRATTTMTTGGVTYDIEQIYPTDAEGQVYVVTFSFSPELPQEDRDQVVDQVVGSWTWTN